MRKISEDLDLLLNEIFKACDNDVAICENCAAFKHGGDFGDFCWLDDLFKIQNRIKELEEHLINNGGRL